MPSLTLIMTLAGLAWGILAPLGTWGWLKIEKTMAVRSAVKTARADEQTQCTQRIATITRTLNNAAGKKVQAASDAVASLPAVPVDAAGVERLCNASTGCRDRVGNVR